MDLNRLTREADEQIRKVVARYNQLYAPGGTISQVELDILLDELRKLYDTFKTIGYINLTRLQHSPKPEVTVHSPSIAGMQATTVPIDSTDSNVHARPESKIYQPEPQPQRQEQLQSEPQPMPKQDSEHEVQNEISKEQTKESVSEDFRKPEPATTLIDEKQQPEAEIKHEERPFHNEVEKTDIHAEQATAMLADRFSQGNKSLSEAMSDAALQEAVGAKIGFHPISDLSSGIGINDRFNFVTELFDNNTGQYQEAITRINKAVNLDEANWIFQKYHTSAWNQKQEVVARMKDFIKRRFI